MSIQSEAALEAGLIATLRQMDYEYVQITEEDNLYANFKRQLEIHNKKQLAEVGRNSLIVHNGVRTSFRCRIRLRWRDERSVAMM